MELERGSREVEVTETKRVDGFNLFLTMEEAEVVAAILGRAGGVTGIPTRPKYGEGPRLYSVLDGALTTAGRADYSDRVDIRKFSPFDGKEDSSTGGYSVLRVMGYTSKEEE